MNRQTNKSKSTKINIRLPHHLATALTQKSQQTGLAKSKLIRKWLNEPNLQSTMQETQRQRSTTSYSMYLERDTLAQIDRLSAANNISRSSLLQILIRNNTAIIITTPNTQMQLDLYQLLEQGKYSEIIANLDTNLEKLDNKEMLLYASAYTEQGKLRNAYQVISELEQRVKHMEPNHIVFAHINLIKARVLLHRYSDLTPAINLLKQALVIAKRTNYRGLIGEIYFYLGHLASLCDEIVASTNYYNQSLEYLDIINFPNLVAANYTGLAWINIGHMNWAEANNYVYRAEQILKSTNNPKFLGFIYRARTNIALVQEDYTQAEGIIKHHLAASECADCFTEQIYSLEELARTLAASNRLNEANEITQQVLSLEGSSTLLQPFTSMYLYDLFLQSSRDFKSASKQFQEKIEYTPRIVEASLSKYLYYSTCYINGSNNSEVKYGEHGLKQVMDTGAYKAIQVAAQNTLHNKSLAAAV